jgi:hypothetical protein
VKTLTGKNSFTKEEFDNILAEKIKSTQNLLNVYAQIPQILRDDQVNTRFYNKIYTIDFYNIYFSSVLMLP